jgi:hypothetical protein
MVERRIDEIQRADDPFPMKLHRMLEDMEKKGKQDILSWNEDGLSFSIYQPKVFADTIMRQCFRQTRYKSFQRQLNLYDFTRETVGKIKGVCKYRYCSQICTIYIASRDSDLI